MSTQHSPTPWFMGEAEIDQGEHGWDGRIYCVPTKEEQEYAESPEGRREGFVAEPYEIATVSNEEDARFIVRAVNSFDALLAACERAASNMRRLCDFPRREGDLLDDLESAIAKAQS